MITGANKTGTTLKYLALALLFVMIVFDFKIGTIVLLEIVAISFFIIFDKNQKIDFPIERDNTNRLQSMMLAGVIYFGFLLINIPLLPFLTHSFGQFVPGGTSTTLSIVSPLSVIQLWSQVTLAFAGSFLIQFIVIGVIVPFAESQLFFGSLLEELIVRFNQTIPSGKTILGIGFKKPTFDIDFFNLNTWLIALLIGTTFLIFHFRAYGVTSTPLLFSAMIFAVISVLTVWYFKRVDIAIYMHMIHNPYILLVGVKLISPMTAALYVAGAFFMFNLLMSKFNFREVMDAFKKNPLRS